MKEKIFNLFVYSNLDIISQVGAVCHKIEGNDKEKISFLLSQVNSDFKKAEIFPLPNNILMTYKGIKRNSIDTNLFRDLCYKGQSSLIFEEVFNKFSAVNNPLIVVTHVVNGKIIIEGQENVINSIYKSPRNIEIEKQDDWLVGYLDNEGFHLDLLLKDDFFEAIKILYNHKHYVSSIKLLMICIDTLSYLEFGDISGNFQKWLNTYTKLSYLKITANELWEFRNSILHMSNLDSRKVNQNKEKRLMFYIASRETNYIDENDEGKYFKFIDLLDCIEYGISIWAKSFNADIIKFKTFVDRYDRIISDKRLSNISFK